MIITPPTLWDDQQEWVDDITASWGRGLNVCGVRPTGTGKTVCISALARANENGTVITAHRKELVSQISMALSKNAVEHRIIASNKTIKHCVRAQMSKLGKSFYNPDADCAASSIDTLIRRGDQLGSYQSFVTRFIVDEGHHLKKGNKWGRGVEMFKNALILGPTATPERSDGAGLGSHADGYYDHMVVGRPMSEYISSGKLSKYKVYAPPSTLDMSNIAVSAATGDYVKTESSKAVFQSSVIGDCVKTYLKFGASLRGVTFVADGDAGREVAARFNAEGVPAVFVDYNSTDEERDDALARFEAGKLLQLVNIDLFGEGFDLPSIECVSFCRPTASYGLYVQQFGRVIRYLEGKEFGLVFDHVGNVARHGLPDAPRAWTLDRRDRKTSKSDGIPLKACCNPDCLLMFQAYKTSCPYCGTVPPVDARGGLTQVDGDLVLLDGPTLAMLRAKVADVDMPTQQYVSQLNVPPIGQRRVARLHEERQGLQKLLRDAIDLWVGKHVSAGRTRRECDKLFYFVFNIDVLSVQGLKSKDVKPLINKIYANIGADLWVDKNYT